MSDFEQKSEERIPNPEHKSGSGTPCLAHLHFVARQSCKGGGWSESCTYISSPGNLVRAGVGANVALKVDVVPLFDVGPVEGGAQAQHRLGHV